MGSRAKAVRPAPSLTRETWAERNVGPESTVLVERDAASFVHQAGSTPCLDAIVRAEGTRLFDASGKSFLDFHGNSVHHLGYAHPRIVEAIKRQLDALVFTPRRYTNEVAITLAEKLAALRPGGTGKVLFATGGSDAMEIALKLARANTGRHATISFQDSYHGNGFGAVSIGGRPADRARIGPLVPGAIHVPPFYRRAGEAGDAPVDDPSWAERCLGAIAAAFGGGEAIAAVVAEPIRSTPHLPPAWFWPEVRRLCDVHGALLVFDEIPTGLGKTGRLFAAEHVGAVPDVTVLGKALGGGVLPIAAVLVDPRLDTVADLPIGHYTHEKNPVTARAALATLEIIDQHGLIDRARELGARSLERLRAIARSHPAVVSVRGVGLLMAIGLAEPTIDGRPAAAVAESLMLRMLELGLSASASEGRGITLTAPLVTSDADMDLAFGIIERALALELGA